uniref:(northern house mosquito) hypothetical protein n=1 Tax=Culex pipiens TaxID=7175 RepID=A0A8D8FU34_CULPI
MESIRLDFLHCGHLQLCALEEECRAKISTTSNCPHLPRKNHLEVRIARAQRVEEKSSLMLPSVFCDVDFRTPEVGMANCVRGVGWLTGGSQMLILKITAASEESS